MLFQESELLETAQFMLEVLLYGSSHQGVAVLLPGFAII